MSSAIEVTSDNFNSQVAKPSYQKTVLVDFYATWCGPCQILKPILEKLGPEYDFILAKIDIDKNRDLATKFAVEGVPDVRIAREGKMSPGFVGALGEPQLREFLAKQGLRSSLELALDEVKEIITAGDFSEAKARFDRLMEQFPNHSLLTIEAAKFLIQTNYFDDAKKLLDTIDITDRVYFAKAQSVKTLIEFKQAAARPGESELDQKFAKASELAVKEDYEASLQLFLEIVAASRKYREDGARKAVLSIFALLGNNHLLTQKYQQELTLLLY